MTHLIDCVVWKPAAADVWRRDPEPLGGTVEVRGQVARVALVLQEAWHVAFWDGVLDLAIQLPGGLRVDVNGGRTELWGERDPLVVVREWRSTSGVYARGALSGYVFSSAAPLG